MSKQSDDEKRAAKSAREEARARDGAAAMREYEAEQRAVLAKTERLRALRLAKQATEAAPGIATKRRKKPPGD
jgi:hypothetical protein